MKILQDLASIIQLTFLHVDQIFQNKKPQNSLLFQYLSQIQQEFADLPKIDLSISTNLIQKEMKNFIIKMKEILNSKQSQLTKEISGREIKKIKDGVIDTIRNPNIFEKASLEEKVILWDNVTFTCKF